MAQQICTYAYWTGLVRSAGSLNRSGRFELVRDVTKAPGLTDTQRLTLVKQIAEA